jgi:acyl-CoA thioesterase I
MPRSRPSVTFGLLTLLIFSGITNCVPGRDADAIDPRRPVFVALGASDAVGVGASDPATGGWPPRVHASLSAETQLLNLGISGATMRDVVDRQLQAASDAHPALVVIWPGVNDLRAFVPRETFARRLDQVLDTLSGNGTQVIVLNVPQLHLLPAFVVFPPQILDGIVREWNDAIAEVVERHNATLVDLYGGSLELTAHPEYISEDGFHPSDAGYQRIADLILAEVRVVSVREPVSVP